MRRYVIKRGAPPTARLRWQLSSTTPQTSSAPLLAASSPPRSMLFAPRTAAHDAVEERAWAGGRAHIASRGVNS